VGPYSSIVSRHTYRNLEHAHGQRVGSWTDTS